MKKGEDNRRIWRTAQTLMEGSWEWMWKFSFGNTWIVTVVLIQPGLTQPFFIKRISGCDEIYVLVAISSRKNMWFRHLFERQSQQWFFLVNPMCFHTWMYNVIYTPQLTVSKKIIKLTRHCWYPYSHWNRRIDIINYTNYLHAHWGVCSLTIG